MLELFVDIFAIGMLLSVGITGIFILFNLRQAIIKHDPVSEKYQRVRAFAEAERRFTTGVIKPHRHSRKHLDRHARSFYKMRCAIKTREVTQRHTNSNKPKSPLVVNQH